MVAFVEKEGIGSNKNKVGISFVEAKEQKEKKEKKMIMIVIVFIIMHF